MLDRDDRIQNDVRFLHNILQSGRGKKIRNQGTQKIRVQKLLGIFRPFPPFGRTRRGRRVPPPPGRKGPAVAGSPTQNLHVTQTQHGGTSRSRLRPSDPLRGPESWAGGTLGEDNFDRGNDFGNGTRGTAVREN